MKDPLVNEYEINQSGVMKIMDYFEKRLQTLRLANDNYKADRSTRGRIAEIKDLQREIMPKSGAGSNAINNAMKS